jgi:N6-L-threonylcarbamoyladenine synthase
MLHGILLARHGGAAQFPSLLKLASRGLSTLAIETSCDDTCVAILTKDQQDGKIRSPHSTKPLARLCFNEKITADNSAHKGIHPIEALVSHRANLSKLIARSLRFLPEPDPNQKIPSSKILIGENGAVKLKPDFISVTRGPGMRSNLSCGLDTAKGLAVAWGIPLVAVHHMQAHALTPRLAMAMEKLQSPDLDHPDEVEKGHYRDTLDNIKVKVEPMFPFLTLLISGGHTLLVHSKGLTEHTVLATTADIAIGDALDKIGRLVLSKETLNNIKDTAFARHLSKYAFPRHKDFAQYPVPAKRMNEIQKPPNRYGWWIQPPFAETKEMAFSFSGISSRVESLWKKRSESCDISEDERMLFAQTALGTAFEHLASRTVLALQKMKENGTKISTLVVSGGVAANDFLQVFLRQFLDARDFREIKLVFPPPHLCTDNAAMIAWTGLEMFEAGFRSDLGCDPLSKWSMDSEGDDGGIAGIHGWTSRHEWTAVDRLHEQEQEEHRLRMKLTALNDRRMTKHNGLTVDDKADQSGQKLRHLAIRNPNQIEKLGRITEQAEAGAKTVAKGLQIERLQFSEAGQAGTDDVEKGGAEPIRHPQQLVNSASAPKPTLEAMAAKMEAKGLVLVNPKKNGPELRDNRRPNFIRGGFGSYSFHRATQALLDGMLKATAANASTAETSVEKTLSNAQK